MTRDYTLESALEAIRRGASDFLPKPVDRARLKRALDEFRRSTTSAGVSAPSRSNC